MLGRTMVDGLRCFGSFVEHRGKWEGWPLPRFSFFTAAASSHGTGGAECVYTVVDCFLCFFFLEMGLIRKCSTQVHVYWYT